MIKNHRGAENAEEEEERGNLNNSDTNGNDMKEGRSEGVKEGRSEGVKELFSWLGCGILPWAYLENS
ncbi:MAG: hypothetical protein QNJ63_13040 [Calothrix sp. MO_192.B10]|nr:hypothetical protein [Calothrix sp. MO_192.B10]